MYEVCEHEKYILYSWVTLNHGWFRDREKDRGASLPSLVIDEAITCPVFRGP